jgi:DNA invertase Pin-like site-specific DNA recombinase
MRFARPVHPEKTVEELEAMLERIKAEPRRETKHRPGFQELSLRLGDEVMDEIVRRYEAGEGSPTIAREYGVAPSALIRALRARGVRIREQVLSDEVVARAAQLYESGLPVQRVADELHVAKSTLLRALKKAGVQMRPMRAPRKEAPARPS